MSEAQMSNPFAYISDMVADWPMHQPVKRYDEPIDRHVKYEFTAALRWYRTIRQFLPDDQLIRSNYRFTKLLRHAAVESGPMSRDGMYFLFADQSWIYASHTREKVLDVWGGSYD